MCQIGLWSEGRVKKKRGYRQTDIGTLQLYIVDIHNQLCSFWSGVSLSCGCFHVINSFAKHECCGRHRECFSFDVFVWSSQSIEPMYELDIIMYLSNDMFCYCRRER